MIPRIATAAALGAWAYAGFLAEPSTLKPKAEEPSFASHPISPFVGPPEPPEPPLILPPARPWRLADNSGQVWEHPDREALIRWVAERNRTLPRP